MPEVGFYWFSWPASEQEVMGSTLAPTYFFLRTCSSKMPKSWKKNQMESNMTLAMPPGRME